MRINKVASKGEAANMMGVQRVGGLEVWDIQVIKDEGREAGGQMEPLRAAVRHSDLVCIAQGSLSGCLITSHLS